MPEGPECTIVAQSLHRLLVGKTLTDVEVISGRYTKTSFGSLENILDRKIIQISNKGKFIYWEFDNESILFSTLGMSGGYSITPETHSRVKFSVDKNLLVWYYDTRSFGTLKITEKQELNKKLSEIGPDMLNNPCSFDIFNTIISNSRLKNKNIASFLLDQKRISGVGNIYKAESCYLAAINPSRTLSSLSIDEKIRLYHSIIKILNIAYLNGGSSQKDFKDIRGEYGNYLSMSNVYRRTTDRLGNPVEGCELGDGRTTWWCPAIQK